MVRSPIWIIFAAAVVAAPSAAGLAQQPSTAIQAPIQLFELGFDILAVVFPLLCVGLYVVGFSAETAHRWIVYIRTRIDLRRYLGAKVLANAAVCFTVFFVAVALWGAVCFAIAPAAGWVPNGALPAPSPGRVAALTAGRATFTQLVSAGTWLYVIVYAAWVGLWAAVFATVALLLSLLTGNRLVAFSLPLVIYWVENLVWSYLGVPHLRAVTSAFPFAVVQHAVAVAAVPMVLWGALAAVLGLIITRRRLELVTLL